MYGRDRSLEGRGVFLLFDSASFAVSYWDEKLYMFVFYCFEKLKIWKVSSKFTSNIITKWLFNLIIAFVTPSFVDEDKANLESIVFDIWGSTCALAAVYTYFVVYETKGLNLECVDDMMKEDSPWQSAGWAPEGQRDEENWQQEELKSLAAVEISKAQ
ncbi:uncharacterized protein RAG0_01942 [Rhynchosporium agropyri]|uniref:Uncharacterized protein n=1 Tax=Rhynchosporium agropyri TaxID=914238 RepID=A0A1E1JZH1_9HELO|nr:uncharacterized protein RAG0_01942 [Rhynchosporium agropyri]